MARREPRRATRTSPACRRPLLRRSHEAGLTPQKAFDLLAAYVQKTEAHNTAGLMRRHIYQGFAKAALLRRRGRPRRTS